MDAAELQRTAADVEPIDIYAAARRAKGLSRRQVFQATGVSVYRQYRLEHRISQARPDELDRLFAAIQEAK